ncbi:DNA-binding transcriptional regulator RamA [Salmonella enterica subsp. enterica serovar Dublin]|nr:DNA-binding transcriptional regulator RamA [Salmonella enterica]EDQ8868407.1 DNA-binding transcriptional regulator RamA [Salmonella enterica subsp. enterica serovar Dublin]EDR8358310.1 DNA-binding transcriptional regulator RamA [Salmonella enterica subsp. enterica serovar Dublin]EDY6706231.1 DNA-binding transcriptional regulator RamA [Salmonella enterica subsp. enterica serovar Dublin]EDZ2117125.1 DNA-binding transcriptional regulator RamA [Salmonella enterica subsp. enterica serovar Dublin]
MTISAQVIDTIVEWIDDNLNQPLRIDDIARHAGYSKWHLQRLQKVYDICLKYGFDSQQTFTRIFTRTFNLPPGAYRKEKHGRTH